jgi:large subunit ribosomal protein L14e
MMVVAGVGSAKDVVGRLATSRSGRDAGSVYLVIGVEGPSTVFVADGRTRSVARPKRKNMKHLELGIPATGMAERLAGGLAVTDEEIRAAIAAATVSG